MEHKLKTKHNRTESVHFGGCALTEKCPEAKGKDGNEIKAQFDGACKSVGLTITGFVV